MMRWLLIFAVLVWQTCVTAQPEGSAQLFRYRFAAENPLRYQVSAQISGTLPLFGGLPVEKMLLEMTLVLGVRQVRSDGNIELSMDVESFKAEMDGQPLPLPIERLRSSLRAISYVVTPWGEVVEHKGTAVLPFSLPIPGLELSQLPLLVVQLVFPKEAILPGHEWNYSRKMTANPSDTPAQFTVKWIRQEAVQGVPTSLFNLKMGWNRQYNADTFDQPTTDERLMVKQVEQNVAADAQVWFNEQEGRLVKATISAQYEQKSRLLNHSNASGQIPPARLSARVQVVQAELATSNSEQNRER